jgi:riboflavin synthase alpha subunit
MHEKIHTISLIHIHTHTHTHTHTHNRSLPADGRNSGHMVQGHVDETGEILERWVEGDSLWIKIKASPAILPYIVEKGYVCVCVCVCVYVCSFVVM